MADTVDKNPEFGHNAAATGPAVEFASAGTALQAHDEMPSYVQARPPLPVLVESAPEGTWAARAGVRQGDALVALNGRAISRIAAYEFAPRFLDSSQVLLKFARAGDPDDSLQGSAHAEQTNVPGQHTTNAAEQAGRRRRPRPLLLRHGYRRPLRPVEVSGGAAEEEEAGRLRRRRPSLLRHGYRRPLRPGEVRSGAVEEEEEAAAPGLDAGGGGEAREPEGGGGRRRPSVGADSAVGSGTGAASATAAPAELAEPGPEFDLFAVTAQPGDEKLGFDIAEPQSFIVTGVDSAGWAARCGINIGDEVVEVSGWGVNRKVEEMTKQEFDICMTSIRPLQLAFLPAQPASRDSDHMSDVEDASSLASSTEETSSLETADSGTITEATSFTVVAGPGEGSLGLSAVRRLCVATVASGGWAARAGVLAGDELREVEVFGACREASCLTKQELAICMVSIRPLRLVFARAATPWISEALQTP